MMPRVILRLFHLEFRNDPLGDVGVCR